MRYYKIGYETSQGDALHQLSKQITRPLFVKQITCLCLSRKSKLSISLLTIFYTCEYFK